MLRFLTATLLGALLLVYAPAGAEVLFDFEGPYLVDPGHTIKDHEMVWHDGRWHCIYIRGEEGTSGTITETELGYAVTADLQRWNVGYPVLTAGPQAWDARNVWAPAIFPSPDAPSRWTMLYTGADADVVQRMGRAYTSGSELTNFQKYALNPILEPDSTAYDWSPSQSFSSFRDPFYFQVDGVHHVLNTVGVIDESSSRRGAVHHVSSPDLVSWTDEGILLRNEASTKAWHDLESVQLIEHDGHWHFFYTEQNELGVRHMQSSSMDDGWDTTQATVLDPEGIAAEVTPIGGGSFLFTRHVPSQHTADHPDALGIYYTLRADTLRFHPSTDQPYLVRTDPLAANWVVRTGTAFLAAPTFGDNALERGSASALAVGHGYVSTRDFFDGPGGEFGTEGEDLGGGATGTLKSRPFEIRAEDETMTLRVGGGSALGCFVALTDAATDSVLRDARGHGSDSMRPVVWDLSDLAGRSVYLWIEDGSTADGGWICVDHVELRPSPVAAPPRAGTSAVLLPNVPNPFNPRTSIRFELGTPGRAGLSILDLRGRRILATDLGHVSAGRHQWTWDGRDGQGHEVASGVYLVRLRLDDGPVSSRRITLLR